MSVKHIEAALEAAAKLGVLVLHEGVTPKVAASMLGSAVDAIKPELTGVIGTRLLTLMVPLLEQGIAAAIGALQPSQVLVALPEGTRVVIDIDRT